MKRNLNLFALRISGIALVMAGLGATPAAAQFWNGSVDNDWHTGANWDGGVVPTFGDNAAIASNVNTNTIANISTANADSDGMFVGLEINGVVVDGTVNHSAFTGSFTNGMVIGRGGATGTYNQSGLTSDPNGPSIVNTGFINVGTEDGLAANPNGTGFYNLSGDAQLNASSFVIMGELFGSNGTMTLNDNAVLNANLLDVDPGGGSTVDAPSLIVGREGTGGIIPSLVDEGTLNIHDNAVVNVADRLHVGDFFGAKGTVNQDGNSVVNSNTVWLGVFDNGGSEGTEGTYNISGTAQLNTNNVIVGRDGAKGTLDVSDSADVNVNGAFVVGDFNGTVGAVANGVVNQSGGTVDTTAWIGIGNAAGTTGTYNLSGGSVHTDADFKVGDNGTGIMNQDGGNASSGTWMAIGAQPGAVGTYNLNAGTVDVGTIADDDLNVGDSGTGTMTQAAGTTVNISNDFNVGKNIGAVGTYTQNGGDISVGSWMSVGRNEGSTGTYNMNGGTITVNGRFIMGAETSVADGPSQGTFNLADGNITVQQLVDGGGPVDGQEGVLVVGRDGAGTMNQSGGTITSQWVDIGGDPGSTETNGGVYSMTGGSLTTTTAAGPGVRVGVSTDTGAGSAFNISGNSTINSAGTLEIGINSDASVLLFGSNITASFGDNMSMSSGTGTGTIGWGSDASGVSTVEIGGDVDVTGGTLTLLLTDPANVTDPIAGPIVAGLPTTDITVPHDLLLVDNQGTNPVTGQLSFNPLDGSPLQLLAQGDALLDPAGLLGGTQYFISYLGLTGTDNDIWLTLAQVISPALAGDYNENGIVDAADYAVWLDNLGNATPLPNDDGLGGPVGQAHYDLWKMNFGNTTGTGTSGSGAVPEPASMVLLGLGVLLFGPFYRRRRLG